MNSTWMWIWNEMKWRKERNKIIDKETGQKKKAKSLSKFKKFILLAWKKVNNFPICLHPDDFTLFFYSVGIKTKRLKGPRPQKKGIRTIASHIDVEM